MLLCWVDPPPDVEPDPLPATGTTAKLVPTKMPFWKWAVGCAWNCVGDGGGPPEEGDPLYVVPSRVNERSAMGTYWLAKFGSMPPVGIVYAPVVK